MRFVFRKRDTKESLGTRCLRLSFLEAIHSAPDLQVTVLAIVIWKLFSEPSLVVLAIVLLE